MGIQRVFAQVLRYPILMLCPIVLDLLAFALGIALVGFVGTPMISYRLILELGVPSVSYLINIPLLPNQLQFMNLPGVPAIGWVAVIGMLLLIAYAQGGYISTLRRAAVGEPATAAQFLQDGKAFGVRFIFLYLMIMFAKTAATTLLVMLFQDIGLFLALVLFIVIRVLFIYLEFTIVVDRCQLGEALRRSRLYFKQSWVKTMLLVLGMFVLAGLLSTLIHQWWSPAAILVGIVLSAYVISAIQLALMAVMCEARTEMKHT